MSLLPATWCAGLVLLALGCTQEVSSAPAATAKATPKYGGCVESYETEDSSCSNHYRSPAACELPADQPEGACGDATDYVAVSFTCDVVKHWQRTPLYDMTCDEWIAAGKPAP